jgi:hypothetical protein
MMRRTSRGCRAGRGHQGLDITGRDQDHPACSAQANTSCVVAREGCVRDTQGLEQAGDRLA